LAARDACPRGAAILGYFPPIGFANQQELTSACTKAPARRHSTRPRVDGSHAQFQLDSPHAADRVVRRGRDPLSARTRLAWCCGSARRILLSLGFALILAVLVVNIVIGPQGFRHEANWIKSVLGAIALLGAGMVVVAVLGKIVQSWQRSHPPAQPSRYRKPGHG
jgi:hypothetical protein